MAELSSSLAFDRVAHEYDRTRGGVERGAHAAAVLAPLLPPDGPLLEVGVGTGLVAMALSEQGWAVAGVDLSLPMLRQAAGRLPGRVVAGDALRLPLRAGSVAGVVMVHVLHVVGDMVGTLAETARVVRPGGRVVVTTSPDGPLPESDLGEIIRGLEQRLGVEDRRVDGEAAVTEAARRGGLALAERATYQPSHLKVTPVEVARLLGTRTWSWTWRVDDRAWADEAPAAVDALRGLPDQDRPRVERVDVPVLAFTHADPAADPPAEPPAR